MAGEKYRVQLTALAEYLNPKNRLYFDRLYDTLLLNGAIYNSEVVSELAYDVLLDLLDAQADGIGAESYFGLSAIQMSKKLLKQVDKKTKSLRNLTIWTVLIGLFWNYAVNISWFGIEPTPISWVCYLFERFSSNLCTCTNIQSDRTCFSSCLWLFDIYLVERKGLIDGW